MTLHPVIGHSELRLSLSRAVSAESLPSSILLHGNEGVGKQRLALWIAQLILCESRTEAGPCGTCHSCRLAIRLEHPDLHWHFPLPRPRGSHSPEKLQELLETSRSERLAAIREDALLRSGDEEGSAAHYLAAARTVRSRAHRRPTMSASQHFIIGRAEMLVPQESSPEAANSLLKLLEEPPDATRFILTTNELNRVLPTIRSRCLPLHIPPLPHGEVKAFLIEHGVADEVEADRVSTLAKGSIGRALGFVDSDGDVGVRTAVRDRAIEILQDALGRPEGRFAPPLDFKPAGARGLLGLLEAVEEIVRDLAALSVGRKEAVVHIDRSDTLQELAAGADPLALTQGVALVDRAREDARGNVNPQLLMYGLLRGLARALRPPPTAATQPTPSERTRATKASR